MIENQMSLPLAIDTADMKATTAQFSAATDAQLLPYTIGYVPYEMIEKSTVYKKVARGLASALPNTFFFYNPSETIANPAKGVPFVYSIKSGTESGECNIFNSGGTWTQLPYCNNNANLKILHSYNTDYYVNLGNNQGFDISGIQLRFRYFECAYNSEGWQGSTITSVQPPATFSVLATITPTPEIALTFSQTINSRYNSTVYTIDNTIFNSMWENGLCELDGGKYTYNDTEYNVKLYIFIDNAYISNTFIAGDKVGQGVLCNENLRSHSFYSDCTWFALIYGNSVSNKFLLGNTELLSIEFPSAYGYYIKISQTGLNFFRTAISSWLNYPVSGGFKLDDIKVMLCTAYPAYKIGDAYYVAEFDDDYVITGKLIPYANAREWQTFINPSSNKFDYNDIPEPSPGGDDAENMGDKITLPSSLGIGGTNGFVTHYALTAADVSQLGALLWTSFVDTDYWKNFLFSLSLETGTLNLSGLLNFFLSLKVYPFSMVNVAGYHQAGQDMYIGTGTVPLHFTTTIGVIGNMCDYIQGGYCDVPAHFKDYRDYINTKITLYVPYCGTIDLNPGDVIGNRVRVVYAVDFATGGCIAYIMMETGDGAAGFPVGALTGQIGADVPLTATAAGEVAARFVSDAMHVGGLVGGEVGNIAGGIAGVMSGQPTGGGSGSGSPLSGIAGMYGGLPAAMGADLAPGIAAHGLTMATRAAVSAPMLSGGRGFASFGAPQCPYIQIRRGIYPEISSYSEIYGNAGAGSYKISELSGYVSGDVKTDGLSCPENEKAAIRKLIANGIYV